MILSLKIDRKHLFNLRSYLNRSGNFWFSNSQVNLTSKHTGKNNCKTKSHHLNQKEYLFKTLHNQRQNQLKTSTKWKERRCSVLYNSRYSTQTSTRIRTIVKRDGAGVRYLKFIMEMIFGRWLFLAPTKNNLSKRMIRVTLTTQHFTHIKLNSRLGKCLLIR